MFQSFIVLSLLPETIYFPSGVTAIELTESVCPSKPLITSPVCISHSFIVLSLLPEIIYCPSEVIATERTEYL